MNVSETVNFTIQDASTPSPEPQQEALPPALIAAASGASATIVGLCVLLYFKKRKR
jgi:hypothetical protein